MIGQMGFGIKSWAFNIEKWAWGIPANFLVLVR